MIFRRRIAQCAAIAAALITATSAAHAGKKPKQTFEAYKGTYTGFWHFEINTDSVHLSSSLAPATITITSSKKGKNATMIINASEAAIAGGGTIPAFSQVTSVLNRQFGISFLAPVIAPGPYTFSGVVPGKKSIRLAGSGQFDSSVFAVDATLSGTVGKRTQTLTYIYNFILPGTGTYTFSYQVSRSVGRK